MINSERSIAAKYILQKQETHLKAKVCRALEDKNGTKKVPLN